MTTFDVKFQLVTVSKKKRKKLIENDTNETKSSTEYFNNVNDNQVINGTSSMSVSPVPGPTMCLGEAIKKTKENLHPGLDPDEIVSSRLEQYQEIRTDVCDALENEQGMTLYICGCPGTGKTVLIRKLVVELERANLHLTFSKVYLQGDAILTRDILYQNIGAQLNINADKNIEDNILKLFSPNKTKSRNKNPEHMTLLFFDEIDQAPFKEIKSLINISNIENSKLIILGTGNNSSLMFELNMFFTPDTVVFKEFVVDDLVNIL